MDERHANHKVCRPCVYLADEPAERNFFLDKHEGGESLGTGRLVVLEKQKAAHNLDHEEKQGQAAEVVPERQLVLGNLFFLQIVNDRHQDIETLLKPCSQRAHTRISVRICFRPDYRGLIDSTGRRVRFCGGFCSRFCSARSSRLGGNRSSRFRLYRSILCACILIVVSHIERLPGFSRIKVTLLQ